jgi:cytochrome b561
MLKDNHIHYGFITKTLHWLIALLMISQLLLGIYTNYAPPTLVGQLFFWHKSLGLLLLFLVIFFVLWRLINIKPAYLNTMPRWEKFLATFVRFLLYAAMLSLPLSGWIMSTAAGYIPSFFGWFSLAFPYVEPNKDLAHLFNEMHESIAWVISILIAIHLLAALKHHFIDKDNILRRMLNK